jgi:hypothetical protein
MNTRFTSIDDLLKEKEVTPLQEAAMNLLAKADYRPEPFDTPFMEGWTTKEAIVAPVRAVEAAQILAVYGMPVDEVYLLRRHFMMPWTRDENGQIVSDYNYKMNIATILLLVFFPFGFYYIIGRWLLVHDTVVYKLSDGSYILVLRWWERMNLLRYLNILWWAKWFAS